MTFSLALSAQHALIAHQLLEFLGMAIGARYYLRLRRCGDGQSVLAPTHYAVLVGCLAGAALGNKLVFWVENPQLWAVYGQDWRNWLGGQSMVGGLLGGLLGVELAKWLTHQTRSTGDFFVFPLLLGLMIGRVGCFLAGLHDGTYGVPTNLPWGVDFGDGQPRHPTQLYEIIFCGLLWRGLRLWQAALATVPGLLFKSWVVAYLLWRLLVDAIKPVPYGYPGGLSGIQWICLLALAAYLPFVWRAWRLWRTSASLESASS